MFLNTNYTKKSDYYIFHTKFTEMITEIETKKNILLEYNIPMLEEEVSGQTKSIWEHIKSFFFNLKSRIISFFSKKAKDGKLPPAIQSKVNNLDNKLKQNAPSSPDTIKQVKAAVDDLKTSAANSFKDFKDKWDKEVAEYKNYVKTTKDNPKLSEREYNDKHGKALNF
jgi:hypothetical protein